jgi:hypothetical protein
VISKYRARPGGWSRYRRSELTVRPLRVRRCSLRRGPRG